MNNTITQEDIRSYDTHINAVAEQSSRVDLYENSEFAIFRNMPSKTKGAAFERIFEEYCTTNKELGLNVQKPLSPGHDRVINGNVRVEIKGSTIWGSSGKFRFSQIRTGQDYDAVVFLFVYPDRIEMHTADKDVVKENLEVQDENGFWIHNQHGGKRVNSGTFWFSCSGPEDVPWLQPFSLCLKNNPRDIDPSGTRRFL